LNNRYNRQILLPEVGIEGQKKINQSRVLVVGAGGLGCPALQYLAGAGVGTIGIIDPDEVSLSNLHRQILFTTDDIGKNKAITAQKRLNLNNELVKITAFAHSLEQKNALEIISNYDIILDCTDNIPTRYLINDACILLNKTFIYGAIHQFEGQIAVFNHNGGPNYRDLFPVPPKNEHIPTCNQIGVLGVLPGIIGLYQANETLKIILGIGDILSGSLLSFSALNMRTYEIKIPSRKGSNMPLTFESFHQNNYGWDCTTTSEEVQEITLDQITEKINQSHTLFIDVRESGEQPDISFDNLIQIPLSKLPDSPPKLPPAKEYILFCRSGQRSKTAARLLAQKYPRQKIRSLKTSIFQFVNYINNVH